MPAQLSHRHAHPSEGSSISRATCTRIETPEVRQCLAMVLIEHFHLTLPQAHTMLYGQPPHSSMMWMLCDVGDITLLED